LELSAPHNSLWNLALEQHRTKYHHWKMHMNSNELERFEEKVHVALRRVNSVLVDEQNSFLDGMVSRSVL
jgi:hypothetical protein